MKTPIPLPPQAEAALLQWAEQLLLANGASVKWPGEDGEWIQPADLFRKLNEHPLSVYRNRLGSVHCPKFPAKRSTTGRLLLLQATPELIKFLSGPKTPGFTRG